MNSEGLTNKQIKNLKDFLRKLGYTIEELGQLDNLKNIIKPHYAKEELDSFDIEPYLESLDEEWIEISNKSWHKIIRHLINRIDAISNGRENGLELLISKIAWDLYIKFDKTISQGQAEAVLKRVLGIKLSSTGRTQLYELRKKIRKYENFLTHFGDLVKTYEFTFKVVILGLSSEQATKLLLMPSIPGGEGQRKTIGVEFYPKMIEILDKRVKLQLWDISSESQWRSYIQRYCKGANGAFIVYDKSERDSYETAKELYKELKEATDLKSRIKGGSRMIIDMPVILIGLGDGDNVIAGEGQSLAKEWGAYGYIEMEDTDSINFENALSTLALGVITNHQNALKKSPRRYRFKITVVGNVEVGKTSLIKQFTKGSFQTDYVKTIGAQYSVISIEIERNKVNCLFWDIAGGEGFHFLHPSFFKNSLAAIIVYSLGEDDSLNQISKWHDEIINECGDIPIIIIGNKSDLVDESKLDISRIQDYVTKYDLLGHFITSAKTGQGIKAAFNKIIEELYNKIK